MPTDPTGQGRSALLTSGLAAATARIATAGSLYYSEVAHLVPCLLCWVQRAFMYPLALVLGLAALRRWPVRAWARAAALMGACVSVWHLLVERFPGLEGALACDPATPAPSGGWRCSDS